MLLGLLVLAALFVGFNVASFAVDPPPMSDEIILDHGFRYEYSPSWPGRSAIAVGEGATLFAYMDHDGGRGFATLHDPSGARAGWNLVELFAYEEHARTFDCSDQDSLGWKIAYIGGVGPYGGDEVLRVRNLHPTTLEPTGPDLLLGSEVDGMWCPLIARFAEGHAALWIDGGNLWHTRVTADLHAIDATPRLLTNEAEWAAAAMGPSGGVVVWRAADDSLVVLRLNESALPVGNPTTIGTTPHGMFDVAPLGDEWLVASKYDDKLDLRLLHVSGAFTTRILSTPWSDSPISVCSSDSVGVVLWGGIWCTRVDIDGEPIGDAIRLDELSYVEYYDGLQFDWDPRAFACAWTGESFALLWHEFAQLITARDGVDRLGEHDRDPGGRAPTYPGYDDVPVFGQWMSENGQPLMPEPLLASQASVAGGVGPWTAGDRTLAVLRDRATQLWLHTLRLDMSGDVLGGPTRIRTPAYETDCGVWWCEWSNIGAVHARPWGPDVACIYTYSSGYSGEYSWSDSESLIIDRLSMEGEHLLRVSVPIHDTGYGIVSTSGIDFAARQDDALAVYSTWEGEPGWTRAVLLSPTGEQLRHWEIVADTSISRITTVPLAHGYLTVWSRREPGGPILRSVVIDPAMPETEITGTPLLGSDWRGWNCRLIPGPDQTLCVFAGQKGDDPATDRLYAVRLDSSGALLDPEPIGLTDVSCGYCYPDGVWDSNHYFVVWVRYVLDEGSSLHGSRIGPDGVLVDPVPFPLGSSGWNPAVSSDSLGNVTLGYGNRVRMIQDLVPLVLDDPLFPDEEEGAPTDLRIGAVIPNPTRSDVRVDLSLPAGMEALVSVHEAGGRRVHATHLVGPQSGATSVWSGRLGNGRRAPAGVYFLRIDAGPERGLRKVFVLR